jgi:hypothetical protein
MRSHHSRADTVVGIDEVFQNAFLEEVPFWITINASPIGLALRALLFQEGSGTPNSFTPSLSPPTDIIWTSSLSGDCARFNSFPVLASTAFQSFRRQRLCGINFCARRFRPISAV